MTNKPCTQIQKIISRDELPLCCPMLHERLRDGHPRVYLNIETTGTVVCPYCETVYCLRDASNAK